MSRPVELIHVKQRLLRRLMGQAARVVDLVPFVQRVVTPVLFTGPQIKATGTSPAPAARGCSTNARPPTPGPTRGMCLTPIPIPWPAQAAGLVVQPAM